MMVLGMMPAAFDVKAQSKPVAADRKTTANDVAVGFVRQLETIRRASFSTSGEKTAEKFCDAITVQLFDLEIMMNVASASSSARMPEAQRSRLRTVLVRRFQRECIRYAHPGMSREISLSGNRIAGNGDIVVATNSLGETDSRRQSLWNLRERGRGQWQIVDIAYGGRSLVMTARSEATAALSRSGHEPAAVIEAFER